MSKADVLRRIYSVALVLATPWVVIHLLYRAIRQPDYLGHWSERFGWFRGPPRDPGCVWIHAVSVGETRAAQPLVEAIRIRWPKRRILLTHMTPTGRDTSGQLFGQSVDRAYLAYDYPGATRRFLHHHRPALGVLMETELWPNLIAQAAKEQVPLILVNARLSERSMKRAQRFHVLANAALRSLSALLAQSAADAERFKTLGANVTAITGSLKFDVTVPPEQQVLGAQFRARIGARPVLLWASTREGEEELLLDAYSQYALPEGTLVILVPRHPQRFGEVAGLVESRGLRMQRRSQEEPILASTQIWLGDSMGEMFAYYCAADLAYIGGGLLPYGTHNLIEASAVGCPVVLGPHTYNFEDAAVSAIAAGAARRVQDAKGLFAAAQEILTDTKTRATMAKGALEFALAHRGATRTTLLTLERYLGD